MSSEDDEDRVVNLVNGIKHLIDLLNFPHYVTCSALCIVLVKTQKLSKKEDFLKSVEEFWDAYEELKKETSSKEKEGGKE
jgi:hypothetical protein